MLPQNVPFIPRTAQAGRSQGLWTRSLIERERKKGRMEGKKRGMEEERKRGERNSIARNKTQLTQGLSSDDPQRQKDHCTFSGGSRN